MDEENREDSKSGIVDFPVHKVTLAKVAEKQQRNRDGKVSFALERRKVLVSASFFSIVLAVSIANFGLDRGATGANNGGRGIASISPETEARYQRWQDELVEDLAQTKARPNAERGENPSDFERMSFGELGGRYAIQVENSKVLRIERADGPSGERQVASAFDGKNFLKNYASLFPGFDDVVEDKSSNNRRKKLGLFKEGQRQATVDIQLSTNGELLSLTVEK